MRHSVKRLTSSGRLTNKLRTHIPTRAAQITAQSRSTKTSRNTKRSRQLSRMKAWMEVVYSPLETKNLSLSTIGRNTASSDKSGFRHRWSTCAGVITATSWWLLLKSHFTCCSTTLPMFRRLLPRENSLTRSRRKVLKRHSPSLTNTLKLLLQVTGSAMSALCLLIPEVKSTTWLVDVSWNSDKPTRSNLFWATMASNHACICVTRRSRFMHIASCSQWLNSKTQFWTKTCNWRSNFYHKCPNLNTAN